jgi:endoribonuclease L-PSP
MNAAFTKFFGTKDQPNKPARTTVQVAALASPTALVEVEVIAARGGNRLRPRELSGAQVSIYRAIRHQWSS